MLAGKFTDPLVGRDLLIGILFGLCFTLLNKVPYLTASQPVADVKLEILLGVRFGVGDLLDATGGAVVVPLAITFLLTLLRALVRRDWLAGAVVVLTLGLLAFLGTSSPPFAVLVVILISWIVLLIVLAFIRFGLLAFAATLLIYFWLNSLPLTTNLSAWYAGTSLFVMFLVTALAGYAFYTSLGGQKVFKGKLLEE